MCVRGGGGGVGVANTCYINSEIPRVAILETKIYTILVSICRRSYVLLKAHLGD